MHLQPCASATWSIVLIRKSQADAEALAHAPACWRGRILRLVNRTYYVVTNLWPFLSDSS